MEKVTCPRILSPRPGTWTIVEKDGNGRALRIAWHCPYCITVFWEIVGQLGVGEKLKTTQRKRRLCPNCAKLRKVTCEYHHCRSRYYGIAAHHNCGQPYPNKEIYLTYEQPKGRVDDVQ